MGERGDQVVTGNASRSLKDLLRDRKRSSHQHCGRQAQIIMATMQLTKQSIEIVSHPKDPNGA